MCSCGSGSCSDCSDVYTVPSGPKGDQGVGGPIGPQGDPGPQGPPGQPGGSGKFYINRSFLTYSGSGIDTSVITVPAATIASAGVIPFSGDKSDLMVQTYIKVPGGQWVDGVAATALGVAVNINGTSGITIDTSGNVYVVARYNVNDAEFKIIITG